MFKIPDLEQVFKTAALRSDPAAEISGVSIDTRTLRAGDLFFAISGARLDGHDYLAAAEKAGAAGFVLSKDRSGLLDTAALRNVFFTQDTTAALAELACFHRSRWTGKTIGITGSVGKTTTKTFLNQLLSRDFQVCSTLGNFNNQYGLPLSLFQLREGHDFLVLEMGASHAGEIRALAAIAAPDIGVITAVEPSHLEGFGSLEGVYRAKLELAIAVRDKGGVLIVNGDNPELKRRAANITNRLVTYGRGAHNDVSLTELVEKEDFLQLEINRRVSCRVPLSAGNHLESILAAFAVARTLGIDWKRYHEQTLAFKAPEGRFETRKYSSGLTVVHDAYNANPGSMRHALESFFRIGAAEDKKSFLVLGDMKELGSASENYHRELGEKVSEYPFAGLVTVGNQAAWIAEQAGKKVPAEKIAAVQDNAAAVEWLLSRVGANDRVLFKASHSMKFEEIIHEITRGQIPAPLSGGQPAASPSH